MINGKDTKELHILTVCGAGVGTSTLMRMNTNEVVKSLNLPFPVIVDNTSLSRANGTRCDLIITFESFKKEVEKNNANVIVIKNLMDKAEIKQKLVDFLKEKDVI